MDVLKILSDVKSDALSVHDAVELLKSLPYEEMDFAKLDHHRELRRGFGETIFCQSKTCDHLVRIYKAFADKQSNVLGTRATEEQYVAVKQLLPQVRYQPSARTLILQVKPIIQRGCVVICTAGTADVAVAEEAAETAAFFGCRVNRVYDVGVAGIHRLFDHLDDIRKANAVVAVAGMEGALPGVLGGLIENPIIAVPTSVGYGASFGGVSALLTMLNSCAEGVAVVNIDNGFGAGYMAAQINRLAADSEEKEGN